MRNTLVSKRFIYADAWHGHSDYVQTPRENLFPDLFRDGFPFPDSLRRHRPAARKVHKPVAATRCSYPFLVYSRSFSLFSLFLSLSLSCLHTHSLCLSNLSVYLSFFIDIFDLSTVRRLSSRDFQARLTAIDNAAPLPNMTRRAFP